MTDAGDARGLCASCGNAVAGGYCSRCGEEVLDPSKLTLRYFLTHTVFHELLNLDGKICLTLRSLLFRPGFLALEYAAGRRRPYINPLRVLIVAIIVYVLATQSGIGFTLDVGLVRLSMAPAPMSPQRSIEATLEQIDRFGALERMFIERVGPPADASDEIRDRFNRTLNGFATPLSFTTVMLVALVLCACFYRRRPLLVEHVVFSTHFFSFVLLGLLLPVLALRLGAPGTVVIPIILLVIVWQFAYLAVAIRSFYLGAARRRLLAWSVSAGAAVLVNLLNSAFITVVQFAGGAFAIAQL